MFNVPFLFQIRIYNIGILLAGVYEQQITVLEPEYLVWYSKMKI